MNPEMILAKLCGGRNIDRLDKMVWVGKNYSIADLKKDLRMIDTYYYNLYKRRPVPVRELPTVDELWEEAYQDLSDSIVADVMKEVTVKIKPHLSVEFIQLDCVVTKEGVEFKEMQNRIEKASKSATANALSQMGGEKKC
jgi:hypothetical protein